MGVWTEYDVLIHNPAVLLEDTEGEPIENFEKLFDWQSHVRVALESGEITDIGNYDSYGRVEVGDKTYEITEYSDDSDDEFINITNEEIQNITKKISVELFTWEKLDYVDLLSTKFKKYYKNEKQG